MPRPGECGSAPTPQNLGNRPDRTAPRKSRPSCLKGFRARRCPAKSGTKGLQKKAKSRPFDYVIVSRKGLRGRRGSPFFGTCLTSLVLVESGCLLLYHGEPTIIVNDSGDSRMARSQPHTINFNVQHPRVH